MKKIGNDEYIDDFGVIYNADQTILLGIHAEDEEFLDEYIIPDGVKEISESAFEDCYYLRTIQIPNSVTTIRKRAFAKCNSLERLIIPDSVITIEEALPCKMSYLQIPEGLLDCLHNKFFQVFPGDELKNIKTIHVTGRANRPVVFSLLPAPNLEEFVVDSTCAYHCSIDGILYSKDQKEVVRCPAKKQQWVLPSSAHIEIIHSHAFYGCKDLKKVWLPESVVEIGTEAFCGCKKIKTINIPNSVRTIGHCFSRCDNLQKVYVNDNFEIGDIMHTVLSSESIEEILTIKEILTDKSCTKYCSVDGVLFDAAKTKLVAFPPAKESREYSIPDGVIHIGEMAFYGSSLEKLMIPKSVASMGDCFPSHLKEIIVDKDNLMYSSRDGVLFNKDRTELLYYPDGRDLQEYTIPETVGDISDYAFSRCMNLLHIEMNNHLSPTEKEALEKIVSRNRG